MTRNSLENTDDSGGGVVPEGVEDCLYEPINMIDLIDEAVEIIYAGNADLAESSIPFSNLDGEEETIDPWWDSYNRHGLFR